MGLALYHHLCQVHPMECPYQCDSCEGMYNNLRELSSHKSNVHRTKLVSCSKCEYQTVSWVKMHQHVRRHTKGMKCSKCGKAFPTITELLRHKSLHSEHLEFYCDFCEAVYHMPTALQIHVTVKHGVGYLCPLCGHRFDSPAQKIRHVHQCEGGL